jgi:hypothetical protein
MNKQDWLDAGYTKFSNVKHIRPYASYGLQKKITDLNGVKYFIIVFVYEYPDHDSFSPDIQFKTKDNLTVNSELILESNSSIEEVESFFERMWEFTGSVYYDYYGD